MTADPPCTDGLTEPPCDLGTLAVGQRIELEATWLLPADHAGDNPIVQTASVSALEPAAFPADDTASALTGVGQEVTDLRLEKRGPSEVVAGTTLTDTLSVTNAGPGTARSVVLDDTPPAGVAISGATAPCDTAPFFPCDLGDLAPGETVVVGVSFELPADHTFPNPLINQATVTSDNLDTDPSNDLSDAVTDVVFRADLGVTKTDGLVGTALGLPVTYTIVVTNFGPSAVAGAAVDDVFPAQLDHVLWCRAAGAGVPCVPDTSGAIDDTVDLAVGESVTFTATGTVNAASGTLVNTVTVTPPAGTEDSVASNDSATDDDTVIVPAADLVVTKTDPALVIPGTDAVYTIEVRNAGQGIARSVNLLDPTPQGLDAPTVSAPCAGGFPCPLGDLAADAVVSMTVTFAVPAGYAGPDTITNVVRVESISPDAEPSDNMATTMTSVERRADLDVTKTNDIDSPERLVPGEAVRYTIRIANLGPSDALGTRVVDTLPSPPAGLLLDPVWTCTPSGEASCGAAAGSGAIDEIVDLPAGGGLVYILDAVVDPAAVSDIVNTVTATPPAGTVDPIAGNSTARDADGVQPTADLAITKTDERDELVPGEGVAYTITVRNLGPSVVTGARVVDTPPAELTSVTWTCAASAGADCGSTMGTDAIDETVDLAVDAEVTFVLEATVDAAATGSLTNTATVAVPPIVVVDPVPDNDSAADTDALARRADLGIALTGAQQAIRGQPLTFVLTVANTGPSDARAVITAPTLPGLGAPMVLETTVPPPPVARCASGFPCTLDLAVRDEAVFDVTFDVPADYAGPDPITFRAAISGGAFPAPAPTVAGGDPADLEAADPDGSNNVDASAVPVERAASADLGIVKAAPAISAVGSTVTYRLTVTNFGPDDATDVLLDESVPDGLAFVSATAPCETGFACDLGTLNLGASRTVEVTFLIPPDNVGDTLVANTASVSSSAIDPQPDNDSDTGLTTLVSDPFDLVLTQSGPIEAEAGTFVTYDLAVTNRGPATALNTRLDNPAPTGLIFASASCGALPCFLDALAADQAIDIAVTFQIPTDYAGPDPISNTATVTADPADAFSDDNQATAFTGLAGPAADLALTKVGPATVATGTVATYALVLRNLGPGRADAVVLDDPTPSGTTLVAVSAPCADGFPCALGDLPTGGAVIVQVAFAVGSDLAAGTELTNTATVTTTSPDPDGAQNSASVTTTVSVSADLAITKTDQVDTVVPGTSVTYTVAVTNLGPSDAPGARVTDFFPAALGSITWTCTASPGSSCAGGAAGSGDIDRSVDIKAGGTVTYVANASIDPATIEPLVNTAAVAAPAAVPDPVADNNTATDTDASTPIADLAITKTDGQEAAVPGLPVTYTITVTNLGPSAVPAADVTDVFVAPIAGVAWTCSVAGGATCGGSGLDEILDTVSLPVGGMVVYRATGTVAAGATGTITNTAAVVPSAENEPLVIDPLPANNMATDIDDLTPRADVAVTKDDGSATAVPGGEAVYVIEITNLGPSDAPSVRVGDTFQAPVVAADWTCQGMDGGDCLAAAGGGSGDIDIEVRLPQGGKVVIEATAEIDSAATGLLVNTATAAVAGGVTDPVADNNAATDTDTLSAEADLAVEKKNGASTVVVGTEVVYTIQVSNRGPSAMLGARVRDNLPAALLDAEWTCRPTGSATCATTGDGDINDVVDLATDTAVTYTLTAIVGPSTGGILSNTASAEVPQGANDPDPTNNAATDADPTAREADLSLRLRDQPDTQAVGDEVTLTVDVDNLGPSPAETVVVTATLPRELAFADSATCTEDAGEVTCAFGDLAASTGAAATLTVTAVLDGTATVAATVSSETFDPDPSNDDAESETTLVPTRDFIFGDGFESGDFSEWSSVLPPGGALPR